VIVDEFKRYVREENRVPLLEEFIKAKSYPTSYGVYQFFDHFDDLVEDAGYNPKEKGYKLNRNSEGG